jgi:hypothetical protein
MYTRYPGFVNQDEYNECFKILSAREGWAENGSSLGTPNSPKFLYKELKDEPIFSEKLFKRIQTLTKKTFKLNRVYANGQEQGQNGEFHMDDPRDGAWTFLLYMNSFDEGGQTEFRRDDVLMGQKAVMNLGIIFESNIEHRGMAPIGTSETRVTVAWKLEEVPKYSFYTEPVPHCVIRSYYTEKELEELWTELDFLNPKLLEPKKTGTATDENGVPKKQNRGLFLDEVYQNAREFSNILKLNRRIGHEETTLALKGKHWFYNYITNPCPNLKDKTLISYYKDGDYYKPHTDSAVATCISYHWREPKAFEEGDLYFGDYRVPIENNCMLIFPSCTEHEVKPVKGSGRYALTQFLSFH